MLTFISCAKTMTTRSNVRVPFTTIPHFEAEAQQHALNLSQFSCLLYTSDAADEL